MDRNMFWDHPGATPFTLGIPEHYLQALILNDNKKWKSLLSMLSFFDTTKYIQRLKFYIY